MRDKSEKHYKQPLKINAKLKQVQQLLIDTSLTLTGRLQADVMEVNKVNLFMRRAERKPDKSVTMTTTNKMAAEEGAVSAGFQQFPLTTHPLPNEEEMKEQICIALNLKDGQQSAGQSTEDPYTQAIKYIEKHRIMEVFQVTIATIL